MVEDDGGRGHGEAVGEGAGRGLADEGVGTDFGTAGKEVGKVEVAGAGGSGGGVHGDDDAAAAGEDAGEGEDAVVPAFAAIAPERAEAAIAEGGMVAAGIGEAADGAEGGVFAEFFEGGGATAFPEGGAAGLAILAEAAVDVVHGGFRTVVEAGDAWQGHDEGLGEIVAAGADGFGAEAVQAVVVFDEGDGFLDGVEAVGSGVGVEEGSAVFEAAFGEGKHGALDLVGGAEFIAGAAEVVAHGEAELEGEHGIEAGGGVGRGVAAPGVLAEAGGVAVVNLAEEDLVPGGGSEAFAEALGEGVPEGVVDVFDGIDAEAIDADGGEVEIVDFDEFIDEGIEVPAGGVGPEVAEGEEIAGDFLAVRLAEAVPGEAFAAVGIEFGEQAAGGDFFFEQLAGAIGHGAAEVPGRDLAPAGGGVEAIGLEGLDPLGFEVLVEDFIAIGIVVENRSGVVEDDVLDDLEAVVVGEFHEIPVVLHAAFRGVGVGAAIEGGGAGEVGVDIEEILGPVAVVSGFPAAEVVSGAPDVFDGWGDPQGGDAEFAEIAGADGEFEAAEVAAVVAVDVGLGDVVEGWVAAGWGVVGGIGIVKTVGEDEIDDFIRGIAAMGGGGGEEGDGGEGFHGVQMDGRGGRFVEDFRGDGENAEQGWRGRALYACLSASSMKSLPLLAAASLSSLIHAAPTVAVYDLPPGMTESGVAGSMSLLSPQIDAARPLTFHDITTSLSKAAGDPDLRAVVVDADDAALGLPQILEIRRHLLALRKGGKDVWVYSDHFDAKSALLGSAANHFMLLPEADSDFAGLAAESMYFKGLLDKVGVQADVIHIGDFKSFGEEFYRTGPSEFAEKQQTELVDGIFQILVRSVAEGRGVDEDVVLRMINQGSFTAAEAEEAGLVDGLAYRTDFNRRLRETYAGVEFDDSYQLPDRDGPEVKGLMDLVKLFMNAGVDPKADQDYVAVVVLEGGISDETVAPVREAILKILKDDKAKAMVLRVDSPGGSALASEVLWEVTDEWKASGRPFAVSMGGVAASGGYYVSAGADRIFAEAGTVTGSIGVVGMKFVTAGAMEKMGITTHRVERGEHAAAMSMTQPFTPEESELVRKSMLSVYATFKKRITDGRGDRLKGELEGMAGGRVYTGERALELGLVDEIGGLAEAIAWASKRAGLAEPFSRLRPEPKSMLEGLFATPEKDADGELVKIQIAPKPVSEAVRSLIGEAGVSALPESARESVSRALERLDGISQSRIQLIGPDLRFEW